MTWWQWFNVGCAIAAALLFGGALGALVVAMCKGDMDSGPQL